MLRIYCGEAANGNSIETRKIMIQISAAFLAKMECTKIRCIRNDNEQKNNKAFAPTQC
ncbi:hypothetical protein D3C73_1642970 [compost metagenome]